MSSRLFYVATLVCGLSFFDNASGQTDSPDFGRDIMPILATHCFACHGPDSNARQADLRLDQIPELLESRPEILSPGSPDDSELVRRIRSTEPDEMMPPPEHKRPLDESKIELLTQWVAAGATAKPHWAFVAPTKPPEPNVNKRSWVRNPIDAFVLARLEQAGLDPSPEADRVTLLRRLSLDLIGLPPTPEEIDAFAADNSIDAYERQVDRLLANPHYGERMALPWLDAARYADSNGFQQDGDTYQYMWRDWVVAALNANMPFDQFTVEQLAGDLLPNATRDQQIATGFNRCHLHNGEGGAIPEEQRNVILFDRVDVTTTTWLALTMACAQCHDHKYDPISQRDYYSLFAFFNNVPESGVPPSGGQYRIADPWIYAESREQRVRLDELEAAVTAARDRLTLAEQSEEFSTSYSNWERELAATTAPADPTQEQLLVIARLPLENRTSEQSAQLRQKFIEFAAPDSHKEATEKLKAAEAERNAFRDQLPRVMVMSDAQPRTTHVLVRGKYEMPGEEVSATTPAVLHPLPIDFPRNRLGLARWLVSPDNPLVARVQVNRYWQLFFGQGLVRTPENFGLQSSAPTHPELLDWLAVEFRESGWDVKRMHRLIVTSATYRQSSRVTRALLARDPENELLARASRFRLSSLILRDVALAASGLLDPRIGGPPVYPYQPPDIWDSLAITKERDFSYPQSSGSDLYRRSLYTFWRRTVAPGNMFDASSRQACKVRTTVTNTPLHALTTLNDDTWVEAARALAILARRQTTSTEAAVELAFRRVCSRRPTADEHAILMRQYRSGQDKFSAQPDQATQFLAIGQYPVPPDLDSIELAALSNVCLTIFNLDEALTRE